MGRSYHITCQFSTPRLVGIPTIRHPREGGDPALSDTSEHGRVDQSGGADDLLREHAASLVHLPLAGCGGDVDRLQAHRVPFLNAQGAVVDAARQAETVFGECGLAVEVAFEHAADLRHGDVAFVDEDEAVVGQIFEQRAMERRGDFTQILVNGILVKELYATAQLIVPVTVSYRRSLLWQPKHQLQMSKPAPLVKICCQSCQENAPRAKKAALSSAQVHRRRGRSLE